MGKIQHTLLLEITYPKQNVHRLVHVFPLLKHFRKFRQINNLDAIVRGKIITFTEQIKISVGVDSETGSLQ